MQDGYPMTMTRLQTEWRAVSVVALAAGLAACAVGVRPNAVVQAPLPYHASMPIPAPAPRPVGTAPAALAADVAALGRSFEGRVGIAVRSIDQGWSVDANGDLRLPQQSVSKLWVAMTVLDFRDSGKLKLDDPVTVTRDDITLFHQPIATLVKGDGYHTTVGELLQRALTMSDNTANDRLLNYVGGPSAIREFLRRKELGNIRFGPGERLLQSGTAGLQWKPEYSTYGAFDRARGQLPKATRLSAFERYISDPPDGAAPAAIANALARLKRGELLSKASTDYLVSTMESSHTGPQRLRGAVPGGWTFGHKTGTGQDLAGRTAGYNDVGFLVAPDGQAYTIAVMIGDTQKGIPARQQLMQAVVQAVVANHRG